MKNLLLISAIFSIALMPITSMASESAPSKLTLAEKIKLKKEVDRSFENYNNAYASKLSLTCTQVLADYQGISLNQRFYQKDKQVGIVYDDARKNLLQILNTAEAGFGNIKDAVADFKQFEAGIPPLDATHITRGYCQSYQKGFIDKVHNSLEAYQLDPTPQKHLAINKNSIYLNSRYQIINMTNNLNKQETPNTLFIGDKSYSINCNYNEPQQFIKAIATNLPATDSLHKATEYFYQTYTPEINYILSCKIVNPSLLKSTFQQISDTYPWYQPIATGSKNEVAAGDAFAYRNKNQLIIVLGHESCACNGNDQQKCDKLKDATRDFNQKAWKIITGLEQIKPEYNSQQQQYIHEFRS